METTPVLYLDMVALTHTILLNTEPTELYF